MKIWDLRKYKLKILKNKKGNARDTRDHFTVLSRALQFSTAICNLSMDYELYKRIGKNANMTANVQDWEAV